MEFSCLDGIFLISFSLGFLIHLPVPEQCQHLLNATVFQGKLLCACCLELYRRSLLLRGTDVCSDPAAKAEEGLCLVIYCSEQGNKYCVCMYLYIYMYMYTNMYKILKIYNSLVCIVS